MNDSLMSEQETLRVMRGRHAKDGMTGCVGEVMDLMGGHVYLRPIGGGIEWTTPRACVTLLNSPVNT